MTKVRSDTTSLKALVAAQAKNTTSFENCTVFTLYDYLEKPLGSALSLNLHDNYIINDVIPYLRSQTTPRIFDKSVAKRYYNRPMSLSYNEYATTEYWWILLGVNGYLTPQEFHDWVQLYIPSISKIEQIIDREMYVNEEFGKIRESVS